MYLLGFCGLLPSILGLFSTRDCWCPSAIGVRETDENRQLSLKDKKNAGYLKAFFLGGR